jgi:hypothetical protein
LFTHVCGVLLRPHCEPAVHSTQEALTQKGMGPVHAIWFCHVLLTQLCTVLPVVAH